MYAAGTEEHVSKASVCSSQMGKGGGGKEEWH